MHLESLLRAPADAAGSDRRPHGQALCPRGCRAASHILGVHRVGVVHRAKHKAEWEWGGLRGASPGRGVGASLGRSWCSVVLPSVLLLQSSSPGQIQAVCGNALCVAGWGASSAWMCCWDAETRGVAPVTQVGARLLARPGKEQTSVAHPLPGTVHAVGCCCPEKETQAHTNPKGCSRTVAQQHPGWSCSIQHGAEDLRSTKQREGSE